MFARSVSTVVRLSGPMIIIDISHYELELVCLVRLVCDNEVVNIYIIEILSGRPGRPRAMVVPRCSRKTA